MTQQKTPKRKPLEAIQWWWNTRVRSIWTVKLPALFAQKISQRSEFNFDNISESLEVKFSQDDFEGITVILTVYKRGEYLPAQIKALRAQSVPPKEIWVWSNEAGMPLEDVSELVDRVVVSNTNWKFWGRFALANMVRTPYIALFDDDILPQPNWFKNCLATYQQGVEGILGGSGVVLPKEGGYSSKHKIGWNGFHENIAKPVDLVGHAWFFPKELLKYVWYEQPYSWENGEDIHFSCMTLKHAGLKTWVPPHPSDDQSVWSCRPDFGKRVGRTSAATHKGAGHHEIRSAMVDTYRANGWKIVADNDHQN